MQGLQAYVFSDEQIETLLSGGTVQVTDSEGNTQTVTYDMVKDGLPFGPAPKGTKVLVEGEQPDTIDMDEYAKVDYVDGKSPKLTQLPDGSYSLRI